MIFTETKMLEKKWQTYSEKYWNKRILAPSAFILYLGISEKLPSLTHHNLLFSEDWRQNFDEDYHSFKGSALGLAHTIWQTAIFRPKNQSKKVSNLFYVGANTSPGIGTQICLISAELVYKRIHGIKSAEPLKSL